MFFLGLKAIGMAGIRFGCSSVDGSGLSQFLQWSPLSLLPESVISLLISNSTWACFHQIDLFIVSWKVPCFPWWHHLCSHLPSLINSMILFPFAELLKITTSAKLPRQPTPCAPPVSLSQVPTRSPEVTWACAACFLPSKSVILHSEKPCLLNKEDYKFIEDLGNAFFLAFSIAKRHVPCKYSVLQRVSWYD